MGKYIIVIFSVIECDSHPCIRAEEIHAGLVRLGPISFKKSRKFLFTFPWTSTMYKVNALFVWFFTSHQQSISYIGVEPVLS